MFLPCRPCCGGAPPCECAGGLPIVNPADFGPMTASGSWDTGAGSVTFTYGAGSGGKTYYFYGSECTSKDGGGASEVEQQDWGNLCNWYTDIERSSLQPYQAIIPGGRLTGRAASLPPTDAVVFILSPVSTAYSGPKTVATAYFYANLEGGTLTATANAHDSTHPCVFTPGLSTNSTLGVYAAGDGNKGTIEGGAKFAYYSGNTGTIASGGADFIGESYNAGDITGNTSFSDSSDFIDGTVTGDVSFSDNSYCSKYYYTNGAYGSVTGNVTASGSAFLLFIVAGGDYAGYNSSFGGVDLSGNAVIFDNSGISGDVGGNVVAWDYSNLSANVTGTTTLNDSSNANLDGMTLTGAVVVNNNAKTADGGFGADILNAPGGITYNDSSYNNCTVVGSASFNDSSTNGTFGFAYGTIDGSATFNGSSKNLTGSVTGNAFFNDSSQNSGLVCSSGGSAEFRDNSVQNVNGGSATTATFYDSACSFQKVQATPTAFCPPANYYLVYYYVATSDPADTIKDASSTAPTYCDNINAGAPIPPASDCGVL